MSASSQVSRFLGDLLTPLAVALDDPFSLTILLKDLGFDAGDLSGDMDRLVTVFGMSEDLETLVEMASKLDDSPADDSLANSILELGQSVFVALDGLKDVSSGTLTGLSAPWNEPDTWIEVCKRLPPYLVTTWLESTYPLVAAMLKVTGILHVNDDEDGIPLILDWDVFGEFLKDPAKTVGGAWGWDAEFRSEDALEAVAEIGRALGLQPRMGELRTSWADEFHGGYAGFNVRELVIRVFSGFTSGVFTRLELAFAPVPADDTDSSMGALLISAQVSGDAVSSFPLTENWSCSLSGDLTKSGEVRMILSPSGAKLVESSDTFDCSIGLQFSPTRSGPLLGDPDGTRIELTDGVMTLSLMGRDGSAEVGVELSASARFVLSFDDADGFLQNVLGGSALETTLSPFLRWSSADGFSMGGAIRVEYIVSLNLTIGPVSVYTLKLVAEVADGGPALQCTVDCGAALGPFSVTFEGLGFSANLLTRDEGDPSGNLGALDLTLQFVPPTGLGLALDMDVVSGGGYLSFDADEERYAGIIELSFLNLELQAYGIITTTLPDGTDGWALVGIMSASFAPIPLGFGFFLTAIGGIFGYNRSVDTDVLQAGIKDGTLDSILFPDDPIANAIEILSDLEAVFPATEGQYLFGPMARIGWPTPAIIDIDLAIVIEAPDPARVIILGQLAAAIPNEEPIIELHVDVVGVLDLDEGTLSVDAALYDSHIALYTLNGQMALRLGWGSQPRFALSVGGFNPRYDPPDDIGDLDRVSVSLDTDNPRISLEGYFAVTSNTVQFGAELEFYASAVGFTVDGHAGFDVLVVFDPFGFDIDLLLGVTIEAASITLAGVDLDLHITGPKPWEIEGSATFKLLGMKKTFPVSLTLPPKGTLALPEAVNVSAKLTAALADRTNWTAVLSTDADVGVTFAETDGDEILVHPAGGAEFRQSVVPLDVALDVYSGHPIDGATEFILSLEKLGGVEVASETWETIQDWFAPGQYFEMTDQEELEGPDYELMTAGVSIASSEMEYGVGVAADLNYECIVYTGAERKQLGAIPMAADVFQRLCSKSATAVARASGVGARRFQGSNKALRVADTPWVVAGKDDLLASAVADIAAGTASTYFAATRAIASAGASDSLQVVPQHESTVVAA